MVALIGSSFRVGVKTLLPLSEGLQAKLLPQSLPQVIQRWHSSNSHEQTTQSVGPAPSQLPLPGDEGYERFAKHLERFSNIKYPAFSAKELEELPNKQVPALQQEIFSVLREMQEALREMRNIHADVTNLIHSKK